MSIYFLALKKKKISKRKLFQELNAASLDEDSNSDIDILEICDDNSADDIDDGTDICLICEERGKDEVWYRCTNCGYWVHAECSGADSPNDYNCDICIRRLRSENFK